MIPARDRERQIWPVKTRRDPQRLVEADGLRGVDAVVDKDFAAALVAEVVGAEALVMLTDVAAVLSGFGTPDAKPLGRVTTEELAALSFHAGSMGPKVAAACRFVSDTGGKAAIGSLSAAGEVIAGTAGTQISLP